MKKTVAQGLIAAGVISAVGAGMFLASTYRDYTDRAHEVAAQTPPAQDAQLSAAISEAYSQRAHFMATGNADAVCVFDTSVISAMSSPAAQASDFYAQWSKIVAKDCAAHG